MQPIEVTARNEGEFFVDKIIDHNGLVRNRKDIDSALIEGDTPTKTIHGSHTTSSGKLKPSWATVQKRRRAHWFLRTVTKAHFEVQLRYKSKLC